MGRKTFSELFLSSLDSARHFSADLSNSFDSLALSAADRGFFPSQR